MAEPILNDWKPELIELIKNYRQDHIDAPTYGYKSKMTKQYVQGKYGVKMEFLDNLTEMGILCDDKDTSDKINALVTRYEKQR